MTYDFCSVADGECEAPCGYGISGAGYYECGPSDPKTRLQCSRCGEPVCRACSRKEGRRRLCNNCIEERELDEAAEGERG